MHDGKLGERGHRVEKEEKHLTQVTLLDGIFKTSQEIGKRFLHSLDVDRLIAPCYESAKLTPKKPRYGGWESTQIAGHSIGHWLSAAAAMYKATGDEQLREKLVYAVDELAYVQSHDPDGYVSGFPRDCFDRTFTGTFEVHNFGLGGSWVPWYSIHKIYAGLIDAYRYAGVEKALDVVIKLADWAKRGTDRLNDEQFQRMLICEHGGMNEAMADLYVLTGNQDYLDLAKRFCHKAILDPLAQGIDELEGKHANTQIPKVIGAAKLYEITGEEKYRKMAEFFWEVVTRTRSYIIGGNSINEHFRPPNNEKLGVETLETCNTYNMLKLTEILFRWNPKSEYMDFYERALYNHILASQDPDSGMKMYFISTEPGHFKVYCTHDDSFWCCVGTGMENPARYTHAIYETVNDAVYVNLFIASKAVFPELGLTLRQETEFPATASSKLTVEQAGDAALPLRIRVPYWLGGEMTVNVNGQSIQGQIRDGYLEILRKWNAGDTIEVKLPMNLHLYRAKDDEHKVGIMYGPVVLAGALGRENFPESDIVPNHMSLHNHPRISVPILVTDEADVRKWVKPAEGEPLTFYTDVGQPGDVRIKLIPFYNLHHERYTIYWTLLNSEEYKNYADHEREMREKLAAVTVDEVRPHEQQSEVEHQIQAHESRSGYSAHAQGSYREAARGGYFSYRMAVKPDKPHLLQVTYFGSDGPRWMDGKLCQREFDIVIDGTVIARQRLSHERPDELFEVNYDIPLELTQGKTHVEVKFASSEDTVAGGVFGVRMVDKQVWDNWKA
jgi:hypothetical protein